MTPITLWPIFRWLDLARNAAQLSQQTVLLYDNADDLINDLLDAHATIEAQFAAPPVDRWYWTLRAHLLRILALTARFAADANLGPLTYENPTQRLSPQTSLTTWGGWTTANQDPENPYNDHTLYLSDLLTQITTLTTLLTPPPANRDRDAITDALDLAGELTTLFLADTRLMS